ncbi:MAG: hypothetical protein BGO09_08115 [Bacteroidetes bacterium 47-18]|nr:MAG: hypothetical protein BGO09_08115 [Bacteroidetes bacterium 47-18]
MIFAGNLIEIYIMKIGIVGDGLTGLLLAWELRKASCEVTLIGDGSLRIASVESAGILTPLANKKNDILADYEPLLDTALDIYQDISAFFGQELIRPVPIIKQGAYPGTSPYFEEQSGAAVTPFWKLTGPFMNILRAWQVNTGMIRLLRRHFEAAGLYSRRTVIWEQQQVRRLLADYDYIFCCEGAAVRKNPLFAHMPFTRNKGDVMQVRIPGLPGDAVYDLAYKLVPVGADGLFWLGSSNIWRYEEVLPAAAFRKDVEEYLSRTLKLPYEILRHTSVERPTIAGQQAVAVSHPEHASIRIINGLGARGYLKAPALVREALAAIL